jgi:hypothetical protein
MPTGSLSTVEAADALAASGTVVLEGTGGITEQQSFAYDIRDTFFNLISADPLFASFTARKTKAFPVQPGLIPYLGVYLIDETMVPDGDANAGCVRFSHTARIGFSVIVQNNDPEVAEKTSDQAFLKIMALLYTDLYVMNVLQDDVAGHNNVENVIIESIVRGTRRHTYGATGTNNETPFLELQYDVSAFFRTEWYPDIVDTLNEIDVKTSLTTEQTSDPTGIEQVEVVYDFTSSRKEPTNGRHSNKANPDARTEVERKASPSPGNDRSARYPGRTDKRQTPRRSQAPVRYSFPRDR